MANPIKAISVKAGYPNSAMGTSGVMLIGVAIGDSYQGGKVAYIDGTGLHGLIAAVADQSTGIIWAVAAKQSTLVPSGTGTTIGTGNQNTINIVAQNGVDSTFAAGLCSNLSEGGYSDWYLPSKDELNQLYINRVVIGGFTTATYWSSSEYDAYVAWYQAFNGGGQNYDDKPTTTSVRAVRAF